MTDALIKNAADETQVKEAGDKLKQSDQRDKNDWLAVMSTDSGYRLLTSLMKDFHTESNPMGTSDRETYFRIGRQSCGKLIKAKMILANKKKYFEMELKLGEEK